MTLHHNCLRVFLYKPPKTNSEKIQEAIDFCQVIIDDPLNDQLFAMMWDFNFPKEVITWTQPELGGIVGHGHGIHSDDQCIKVSDRVIERSRSRSHFVILIEI